MGGWVMVDGWVMVGGWDDGWMGDGWVDVRLLKYLLASCFHRNLHNF